MGFFRWKKCIFAVRKILIRYVKKKNIRHFKSVEGDAKP